jgi:hypothetical protein
MPGASVPLAFWSNFAKVVLRKTALAISALQERICFGAREMNDHGFGSTLNPGGSRFSLAYYGVIELR